jgi:hypothetical protein
MMAKKFGFSAAAASLAYIRDNASVMMICASAPQSYSAAANQPNKIVSANVSGADFTVASGASGPTLTVGAKNSQAIEGSGSGTHVALVSTSATRLLYVTNCSAQVLSSGNTVNIGSWVITQLSSANNS